MATTSKEIGNIFKEAREKLNLSVEDAYRKSRIHPAVIKDIENGVFDRIGKLYVKSFLKKYSIVLGLDPDNVMKEYESIAPTISGREFDLGAKEKEEKDEVLGALTEKRLQMALAAILSVILVFLIFVLIGMMKSKMMLSRQTKETAVTAKKITAAPAKTQEKVSKRIAPAARTSASVTLTLKAREDAWLQVTSEKDKIFEGVLEKGDSKTWKSDGTLTVWTGKADKLDFTVNNRRIGKIAAGVVKNIKISSGGIRIGDTWVTRLK